MAQSTRENIALCLILQSKTKLRWLIESLSMSQACLSLGVKARTEKKMLLQAESSWYLSSFPTFSKFNLKTFQAVSIKIQKKFSTLNPKPSRISEQEEKEFLFWHSDTLLKCRELSSEHFSLTCSHWGERLLWGSVGLSGVQHHLAELPYVRCYRKVHLSSLCSDTLQCGWVA